jgi:acyl-coenzyme A thioesterase PaaI-like protein
MNDVFDQFKMSGWDIVTDDGFVGLVGPFVKKSDADGLVFGFPTFDKHRNHRGVVQGGALVSFADRALGFTVRHETKAQRTATIQLNVQFIDVAEIGEFIETRPIVTRATKQIVFMNATLMAGPRIIAIVQGIFKILREK